MDVSATVGAVQVIVSVIVAILCTGAIPFAMTVSSRLAAIETTLKTMASHRQELDEVRRQYYALETKVAKLESAASCD